MKVVYTHYEGLQKVSQTEGPELHVAPRDITNKHIMAYGKVWTAVNRDTKILLKVALNTTTLTPK
jgi:hypothetical protein